MTIEQFIKATPSVQKTIVKLHGSFQLKRNFYTGTAKLYQVDNFYVEITLSFGPNPTPKIKCYSYDEIDDYLSGVDISGIQSLLT